MKVEIFENNTRNITYKNRTFNDPVDPVLEKVDDDCYILSFKQLDISVLRTMVYFSTYYSESYMEIENKKYDIYNIPDNFDKINALLEKYKLSKVIEKLP